MAAPDVLKHHLRAGSTGILHGLCQGGEIRLRLRRGRILAVASPRDGEAILARLLGRGILKRSVVDRIRASLAMGASLERELAGIVPDSEMITALAVRLKENLDQFMEASQVRYSDEPHEAVLEGLDLQELEEEDFLAILSEAERSLLPEERAEDSLEPMSGELSSPEEPSGFWEPRVGEAREGEPVEEVRFRDHDRVTPRRGEFTVARELLDYVDLGDPTPDSDILDEAPADEPLVLEMEEATQSHKVAPGTVTLTFGSPPLAPEEIVKKTEVVNDVLRVVCATLDRERGVGTGRASLLVLLEGAPARYAALLKRLEPLRDGSLPEDALRASLEQSPEPERRGLLNGALQDLIERSLLMAAERLSDPALEKMLEGMAGYQARMGR